MMRIDNLQYANWSEKIFRQMREGGADAVHVAVAYHENSREPVLNFEQWNRWFEQYPDLIVKGQWASDADRAKATGKTAIFFGFQNLSPIEGDIGLVVIVHSLGARFIQLTYNNQSLLTVVWDRVHATTNGYGLQVLGAKDYLSTPETSVLECVIAQCKPHLFGQCCAEMSARMYGLN